MNTISEGCIATIQLGRELAYSPLAPRAFVTLIQDNAGFPNE
jgi:hypothetical protein